MAWVNLFDAFPNIRVLVSVNGNEISESEYDTYGITVSVENGRVNLTAAGDGNVIEVVVARFDGGPDDERANFVEVNNAIRLVDILADPPMSRADARNYEDDETSFDVSGESVEFSIKPWVTAGVSANNSVG